VKTPNYRTAAVVIAVLAVLALAIWRPEVLIALIQFATVIAARTSAEH
jgi:hypothetical protein